MKPAAHHAPFSDASRTTQGSTSAQAVDLLDCPLEQVAARAGLPVRSVDGRAFLARLMLLRPALSNAVVHLCKERRIEEGNDAESGKELDTAAAAAATTALLSAYLLIEPYAREHAHTDGEPFRADVEAAAAALEDGKRPERTLRQGLRRSLLALLGDDDREGRQGQRDGWRPLAGEALAELLGVPPTAAHTATASKAANDLLSRLDSFMTSKESPRVAALPPSPSLAAPGSGTARPGREREQESSVSHTDLPLPTLLSHAAERTLNLSELRSLFEQLDELRGSLLDVGRITHLVAPPEALAHIGKSNPKACVAVLELLCCSSTASGVERQPKEQGRGKQSSRAGQLPEQAERIQTDLRSYLAALGAHLPTNSSRSFDVLLRALTLPLTIALPMHAEGEAAQSSPANAAVRPLAVPLSKALHRYALPTYLSRCMSDVLATHATRVEEQRADRLAMGADVVSSSSSSSSNDGGGGGGSGFEGDDTHTSVNAAREPLHPQTSHEVQQLVGFIERTGILSLRGQVGNHNDEDFDADEDDAVTVEMKAFALQMVRYRAAGELLRRLV